MTANNLFPLKMNSSLNVALKSEVIDEAQLWHLRYGHLNHRGLMLLRERNMAIGLPKIQPTATCVCEGCVYGKQHRLPFPNTSWRAKAPLELVHADICGLTQTPTIGNRRYFLLFVDDYTRMIWVYFLEKKSEAFTTFLSFKANAEKQSGYQIKTLRTDREGEFIYKPFLDYCKQQGIQRQLTVKIDSYLQKNRFERSLVEPSLYVQKCDADFLVACLYVDDLIYTSTSKLLLEKFKKAMMDEFEMTDLGLMKYFLGLQVKQSKGEIIISQEKYVADILKKFRIENAKAVATPMALNEKLQQDDGAEMFDSKIYRSLVAIATMKNPVFHARSKHIELRHHFIREMVMKKEISMEFIHTQDQPADVLIKVMNFEKLELFKKFLKITN
ncbi:hypothetical protein ZIOFF_073346 [Zingiber officinale]|uniref:Integrase catalytic domain-containing protein n=1 Tax=Zingiber officinale TaxID=94328 RepID=A0A8J5ETQ3_ZINOF|nr:hypothetical protein ZIOFF_073346 [Zingiber officinale]